MDRISTDRIEAGKEGERCSTQQEHYRKMHWEANGGIYCRDCEKTVWLGSRNYEKEQQEKRLEK